jgi:hypothetical protein
MTDFYSPMYRAVLTTKADCRSLAGTYVDFFKYDQDDELTWKDMEFCLAELRRETSGDVVLGAVIFNCITRFDMLDDRLSDAQHWARYFPEVPCTPGLHSHFGKLAPTHV